MLATESSRTATRTGIEAFQYPQPSYERFRSTDPAGFGLLTVHNTSVMAWGQLNARTGEDIDAHVYHR